MTLYRPSNPPGCVVYEYRAWKPHSSTPLREAITSVDTIHTRAGDLLVTDLAGDTHRVTPDSVVFQRVDDYLSLGVCSAESFASDFEVSTR